MASIVIASAVRTPIGAFQGCLQSIGAPALGGFAIKEAIKQAKLDPSIIDQTIMGCVLQAGLGQAPARQAGVFGGVPLSVPALTVNKVCGSALRAVTIGYNEIMAKQAKICVVGGMENMSQAPYLSLTSRSGMRLGHGALKDHMFLDGLEDAYEKSTLMGVYAEACASYYKIDRAIQDEQATHSLMRAKAASEQGKFSHEMVKLTLKEKGKKGEEEKEIILDELPQIADLERIKSLKPAFANDGTVTAANASAISDGAAALILCDEDIAKTHNLPILARVEGHANYAGEPNWFTTAPIHATRKLLNQLDWHKDKIDLWEVNEAFAVVSHLYTQELGLNHEKVNIHGGACALGHPIGASGARILVTLIHALRQQGGGRGLASICIGGGEAIALAIMVDDKTTP